MDAYKSINNLMVHLFNDILKLEENAVITEEFKDLTNNDMHIIEAVGLGEGSNMSMIARKLGITVGSLTTSMNSLVNKKYVVRERSEADRRIVYIRLTPKGEKAYRHHEEFHKKMVESVVEKLSEEEVKALSKALDGLVEFFQEYSN
ncbi:MarR family transcriptional regulator [Clostridium fessum]|uniref:MarR family winged helix-turn-helix transcriptional regulator n=1 Tax=Clostridium fessum TaxID=2126740 RepID=UPI0015C05413